jgi:hypothetical protein
MVLLSGGCKKTSDGNAVDDANVVALAGVDLKPDGTITDNGLQQIQKKADAPSLRVVFVRVRISDGALAQLAKFPNVRRIQAPGSPLSAAAIGKLKAAIPEAVVEK